MPRRNLKDNFEICVEGSNQWYPMTVPGSAMGTFYRENILPDPYEGLNEYQVREFFRNDFRVRGTFTLTPEEYEQENLLLVFHGIDTIADIFLNGKFLGHTENMHRRYTYFIKGLAESGENRLEIALRSPIGYIESVKPAAGREIHMVSTGTMPGSQYIRKPHCMFGWDWGPQLPDAGIFREIELCAYSRARLGETLIRQRHGYGYVSLEMETEILAGAGNREVCVNRAAENAAAAKGTEEGRAAGGTCTVQQAKGENTGNTAGEVRTESSANEAGTAARKNSSEFTVRYEVLAPGGKRIYEGLDTQISIEDPQLWWPNGYGKQPLYTVKVSVWEKNRRLDEKIYRIGLRTLTVSRDKDRWGEEFAIQVNGVKIFVRGADYIPDDCFYSRITEDVLRRDVRAAVFANFNCLRVWGGGYYPSDAFYDLCDENGILLWQDLMFACNIYDLTDAFAENIVEEARDNLLRFRNHACLALICGNNEMEIAWTDWGSARGHAPSLKRDYLIQFEYLLANVVRETAPDTFYWPSSPSSGGSFDLPGDENRGDCHYWDVWHGQKPFEEYLNHCFRFCSEFGFQSLPSVKTIETFTKPSDRNLFSRVMESHQKNPAANGKILYYLSESFRYPKDLESLSFLSQVLQGYAMKTATDHWRRNRGRCMGSIYWQFNDNWPSASWSSMDYYGRYKALHYMARRFDAPVAGSIQKDGAHMGFWISNETKSPVSVQAKMTLKTLDFVVIDEMTTSREVRELSAECLLQKDYGDLIKGHEDSVFVCVEYTYLQDGVELDRCETEIFVPVKYLELGEPHLKLLQLWDGSLELSAESFVPYCMLECVVGDCIWEDNVVAVTGREPVWIKVQEGSYGSVGNIRLYDVYHTYS